MKKRYSLLVLLLAVCVFVTVSSISAEINDGFIIQNADATNTLSTSSSSVLGSLIATALPRIVVQFANDNKAYDLVSSSTLNGFIATVSSRIVVEYANANQLHDLVAAPAALQSLLGQVQPRFVIEYANANRDITLAHPTALINDNTAPQNSGIGADSVGEDRVYITWTTDEVADSTVQYGTQSGNYPETVTDSLYVTNHQLVLNGLVPGVTYFYKISSTDPSGNTTTSIEYSFEMQEEKLIYLPMITR